MKRNTHGDNYAWRGLHTMKNTHGADYTQQRVYPEGPIYAEDKMRRGYTHMEGTTSGRGYA